jgi:hypothetical protein
MATTTPGQFCRARWDLGLTFCLELWHDKFIEFKVITLIFFIGKQANALQVDADKVISEIQLLHFFL